MVRSRSTGGRLRPRRAELRLLGACSSWSELEIRLDSSRALAEMKFCLNSSSARLPFCA